MRFPILVLGFGFLSFAARAEDHWAYLPPVEVKDASIDTLLGRHCNPASPQVRAARQKLSLYRMELVNDARAALVEAMVAAASSTIARGARTLTAAMRAHDGCATALPTEFAEAQTQLRSLIERALAEISSAAVSTDYQYVSTVLDRAREYPSECTSAVAQLESHARSLVQAARDALLQARSCGDLAAIDDSLSGAGAFGEELAAEVDATAAWRTQLLSVRELISTALHSTDLAEIEKVLGQCAQLGPVVAEETRALREHVEVVSVQVRTAVEEIGALLECDDLERVTKAIVAYSDQPASAIREACAALQQKQRDRGRQSRSGYDVQRGFRPRWHVHAIRETYVNQSVRAPPARVPALPSPDRITYLWQPRQSGALCATGVLAEPRVSDRSCSCTGLLCAE